MGVLSARGWQWEACDRSRGVLPWLLGAVRRREGAPHPPASPCATCCCCSVPWTLVLVLGLG